MKKLFLLVLSLSLLALSSYANQLLEGEIAFFSTRDNEHGIYVMHSDGSNQRKLVKPAKEEWPMPAIGLSWSPDEKHIIFSSKRDGNGEIYIMNSDGSKQRNLTNNPADDNFPVWFPDGEKLIFRTNRDGNWEIYSVDLNGKNPKNLTNNSADDMFLTWR
ncbi:PD40 domain-containing protein [bacterium]|nr:PD40 domain-containing protein [bacterium]